MKRLLLVCTAAFCTILLNAQLLTWTPLFPKENDPSQSLVITVDATKGNQGLNNYTPVTDVYVHLGVITNKSASSSDWKYVIFNWGVTSQPQAQATSLGGNKWSYTITGSLRSFFGITDASESIQKIAILFRNGNGNYKQANSDGSDMYIPIYGSGLFIRIDKPPFQPKYVRTPEPLVWTPGTNFSITANANTTSTLTLYHNGNIIAGPTSNVSTITGNSSVLANGNQQIIAMAFDGTNTSYDTLNVFVGGSPTVNLPVGVRDGINYEAGDTTATLVLRAPGKTKATVIGDFNNWTQDLNYVMNKTPDGKFFWIRLHNLNAGTEYAYQYIVDDTIKIADPYTEKILDPNNDSYIPASVYPNLKQYPAGKTTGIVSILQTASPRYNWSIANFSKPDKRNLIIYELLVRDFVANHDWKTVMDSLHYFKNLGINAIEVMPFNEFEGNDSWGYNPDFYFAPDKYYGPANSLKQFIDSCHSIGIAVIQDIALNHSFGSSPMVQLYYDNLNNRPAGNNPWFNPVAKHAFNVGYDMNHESPDTKYFVSRVMEFWTQKYNIDGFRFDLAKGFTQKQTCDNSGNNCDVNAWNAYDISRITIWKGYYDSLQLKSPGSYAILEYFADNTEEKELSNYGMMLWGNMNANYSQAAMGYSTNDPGGNPPDFSWGIYKTRGWSQPYLVSYMESHDEERIMYKVEHYGNSSSNYNIKDTTTGLKRIELAGAFFYTIPGPKMLWQFGELGYDYSINTCTDGTINNNCRLSDKPIRWDYLTDPRRKELHDVISSLIQLRFHPWYKNLFISGNINYSFSNTFKWITLTSASDTSDLVAVGNFDVVPQTGTVSFPTAGSWYDYLNNTPFTTTGSSQSITLQPGEYHVYTNRNTRNANATPVTNVPWSGATLQANVFPNPAHGSFLLNLDDPDNGKVSMDLYNLLGQKAGNLYNGFLSRGSHELTFQTKNLAKGSYYLKINTKNYSKTLKLTIQ